MTPRQLYEWASENILAMAFTYCITDDYKWEKIFLHDQFQQSRTIPGTQKQKISSILKCFLTQALQKRKELHSLKELNSHWKKLMDS